MFDVEGLGCDQPVAIDAVVAEIVDVKDGVDPDAHFHQCLAVGSDIHQKNLLMARSVLRLRRWRASERIPVGLRGQQPHLAMANAMQLGGRPKDAIEARHVGIVHQVEIALHRLAQVRRRRRAPFRMGRS